MSTPSVFTATDSLPILLRVGDSYADNGEQYEMLALSRAVAPAGPGGECAFYLLYITTLHYDVSVSVWITPIVDGVALPTQRLDLIGVPYSKGERQTHEVSTTIPYVLAGTERLRYASRGTWIQVQVETKYLSAEAGAAPAAAKQIVESIEIEHEVVRETKVPIG